MVVDRRQHPGPRTEAQLSPEALNVHKQALNLYDRVQRQQRSDTGKILHPARALRVLDQQRKDLK